MMFAFAAASATLGIAEEYVPFAIILVSLCAAMRLDAITAIGTLVVGYGIGYGVAFMNPFTLVIAQEISGLEPLSGMWLRLTIDSAISCDRVSSCVGICQKNSGRSPK